MVGIGGARGDCEGEAAVGVDQIEHGAGAAGQASECVVARVVELEGGAGVEQVDLGVGVGTRGGEDGQATVEAEGAGKAGAFDRREGVGVLLENEDAVARTDEGAGAGELSGKGLLKVVGDTEAELSACGDGEFLEEAEGGQLVDGEGAFEDGDGPGDIDAGECEVEILVEHRVGGEGAETGLGEVAGAKDAIGGDIG